MMAGFEVQPKPNLVNIRDGGHRGLFEAAMMLDPSECLVREFDTKDGSLSYSNKLRVILHWHAGKGRYKVYIVREA